MTTTIESFIALDDRLASKGVPPTGAWWRAQLATFYRHPTALTLAACAGRGGAKSFVARKIALHETLLGQFAIPPGERHWATLVSRHKDECAVGIGQIARWLDLLGEPYDATADTIELRRLPCGIRIHAASVAASSGWRSYFRALDETSKWPTSGALAVDAREVMTSTAAQLVTHPRARSVIVSSAFVDSGPFYELISAGSTAHVVVAGPAPTWIATDNRVTEAATLRLEPNVRVHTREYGCVFSPEWSDEGFFGDLVPALVGDWTAFPPAPGRSYIIAIDPAFSRDLFAIVVVHLERSVVVVDRVEAMAPPRSGGLSPTECMRRVRALADLYRVGSVLSDQHHAASLVEIAAQQGVSLRPIPWSATSKAERYETVRSLMRDRRIALPNDQGLLRELAGIAVRLRPGGGESIEARHGTDDRVAALVLAVSSCTTANVHAVRMVTALETFARRAGPGSLRRAHDFHQLHALARGAWKR